MLGTKYLETCLGDMMAPEGMRQADERDLGWHQADAAGRDPSRLRQAVDRRKTRADLRAARVYLEALHAAQPCPETALELAAMHRKCHDHAAGLDVLDKALAHWPKRADILQAQAELATRDKQFGRAASLWTRLIAGHGVTSAYPVLRAIACHRLSGDEGAVASLLERNAAVLRSAYPSMTLQLLEGGVDAVGPVTPGLYMVTGNNGTGKTTLGHALQAMGFTIIDADIDIAAFCRGDRWSVLRHDLTRGVAEAEAQVRWLWPASRFDAACAAAKPEARPVFVIGGFGQSVAPYISRARKVFHFTAPTDVIARRLARRGSPAHLPGTAGHAAALRRNARQAKPDYPAHILQSDRPVWHILADMLDALHCHAQETSISDPALQSA